MRTGGGRDREIFVPWIKNVCSGHRLVRRSITYYMILILLIWEACWAISLLAATAAVACRRQRRRRRRSVRSGRGPVHQVGPGQSVAVYVVVRLFTVAVGRLGRSVRQRFGLGAHLENAKQKKNHTVNHDDSIILYTHTRTRHTDNVINSNGHVYRGSIILLAHGRYLEWIGRFYIY